MLMHGQLVLHQRNFRGGSVIVMVTLILMMKTTMMLMNTKIGFENKLRIVVRMFLVLH
jgi:hypothetical protein